MRPRKAAEEFGDLDNNQGRSTASRSGHKASQGKDWIHKAKQTGLCLVWVAILLWAFSFFSHPHRDKQKLRFIYNQFPEIFQAVNPPLRFGMPQTDAIPLSTDQSRFWCDKTLLLPIQYYNDNYCDCMDGTDEPGTGACSHIANISFSCTKGNSSIPTSFINDGICDCCDGSDEWKTAGLCSPSCE